MSNVIFAFETCSQLQAQIQRFLVFYISVLFITSMVVFWSYLSFGSTVVRPMHIIWINYFVVQLISFSYTLPNCIKVGATHLRSSRLLTCAVFVKVLLFSILPIGFTLMWLYAGHKLLLDGGNQPNDHNRDTVQKGFIYGY